MKHINVTQKGHVTIILINRPMVKNAVDGDTAKELADAFRKFEKDDNAFVAILGGTEGTFCAGADLKAVAGLAGAANELSPDGDGPMGPTRMTLSKPVIAAVSGHAVAGGLELACWCDLRVVEESAVLGVCCRRWGVPLIDGGTVRLTRLIGQSRAMDLILTGRPVDAAEALLMGLANRVVADGTSLAAAEELALTLTRFPQTCMRNDRTSVYDQWNHSVEDAMTKEFKLGLQTIASKETHEGATRFASGKGRHGDFEDL